MMLAWQSKPSIFFVIPFHKAVKPVAQVKRGMVVCSASFLTVMPQKIEHTASYENNRKNKDLIQEELPISRKAEV